MTDRIVDLLGRILSDKNPPVKEEPKGLSDEEIISKTPDELRAILDEAKKDEDADRLARYIKLCDRVVIDILRCIVDKKFTILDGNTIHITCTGDMFGFSSRALVNDKDKFLKSLNLRLNPRKIQVLEAFLSEPIFQGKDSSKNGHSFGEYYKIEFIKDDSINSDSKEETEDSSTGNQDAK